MEQSEFLRDNDKNVQFIEGLIEKTNISLAEKTELQKHIEQVKRRFNEPTLYVTLQGGYAK